MGLCFAPKSHLYYRLEGVTLVVGEELYFHWLMPLDFANQAAFPNFIYLTIVKRFSIKVGNEDEYCVVLIKISSIRKSKAALLLPTVTCPN